VGIEANGDEPPRTRAKWGPPDALHSAELFV
jgi:hypothetical protein